MPSSSHFCPIRLLELSPQPNRRPNDLSSIHVVHIRLHHHREAGRASSRRVPAFLFIFPCPCRPWRAHCNSSLGSRQHPCLTLCPLHPFSTLSLSPPPPLTNSLPDPSPPFRSTKHPSSHPPHPPHPQSPQIITHLSKLHPLQIRLPSRNSASTTPRHSSQR